MKWILAVGTVVALSFPAHAQYRNQGAEVGIGMINLHTWDLAINGGNTPRQNLGIAGAIPQPGWNLFDQPAVEAGYFLALGYDLWWDSGAALGAWTTVIDNGDQQRPVMTLQINTGLRYNFLEDRWRPFVAVHLDYLMLIGVGGQDVAPVPLNSFLNQNMFIGVCPGGGLEWVFGDEQSALLELDFAPMLVPDRNRALGGLFLPASTGKLVWKIYF